MGPVCLDPKDKDKAVKREHYQTLTTESILAKLDGAKYFTKLDARCLRANTCK